MAQEKTKRNFTDLNPPTTGKGAKLYADYKAAMALANTKREAFDNYAVGVLDSKGLVPAGKSARISHMFGKLSYEIVDQAVARHAAAKKTPVDLS